MKSLLFFAILLSFVQTGYARTFFQKKIDLTVSHSRLAKPSEELAQATMYIDFSDDFEVCQISLNSLQETCSFKKIETTYSIDRRSWTPAVSIFLLISKDTLTKILATLTNSETHARFKAKPLTVNFSLDTNIRFWSKIENTSLQLHSVDKAESLHIRLEEKEKMLEF